MKLNIIGIEFILKLKSSSIYNWKFDSFSFVNIIILKSALFIKERLLLFNLLENNKMVVKINTF